MVARWAVIPVSIALWYVTLGTTPIAALAWLAPIPVFALAQRLRPRATFGAAFVSHAAGGLALWPYLHGVIGAPIPVILLAIAAPSIIFALTALWMRALGKHFTPIVAAAGTGAAAATLDLGIATFSVHGSFGSIAYTQLAFPPVTQLAALGGNQAIVFTMATVAAAAALAIAPPDPIRRRRGSAVLALGLLGATILAGTLRLSRASHPDGTLRVALLAADAPRNPPHAAGPAGRALIDRYEQAVRALPRGAQDVVLLPERIVDLDGASQAEWTARWAMVARERGMMIVSGAAGTGQGVARNAAFVSRNSGDSVETYFKQHLLPPFELRFTPGTEILVSAIDAGPRIGVMICKDADFAELGRRYANAGIQALLVPAWDFSVDGELHARMAMMRGIEGGYAVVRSARWGMLTVSDAYGRVQASLPSNSASMAVLLGEAPLYRVRTPYARFGKTFGVACLLLTVVIGAMLRGRLRQVRVADPTATAPH
jgi:apolipoprotein N-acyltransferase